MSRPLRVLFVAHDAYRAGATIFLLNMLRWMREHTDVQFDVALCEDGEMVAEFEQVCRSFVLVPSRPSPGVAGRLRGWWARANPVRRRRTLRSLVESGNYDLLYLNTITLGGYLAGLQGMRLPVITHVHELEYAIRRNAGGQEQRVLGRSDRLICVSGAVVDTLVRQFGCPPHKALRIPGFTPEVAMPQGSPQERRARLLDPLRIPRDALLVGVCAHATLMKGVDLAVPLATLLPTAIGGREVHLLWVGSDRPEYPRALALADARKAGVSDRVHFPGMTRTPAEWVSLFDVHLMLSREDSFGLVVIEAATFGTPTVAFAGAVGAAEFIGSDAGRCTPFLDLPAMADAVRALLENEPLRRQLGETARARVRQQHGPEVVLPEVVRVMKEVVAAHANAA